MHLDPAWIALIGTLCGGIGLKVLEHWLGRSKVKFDESTKLREELRTELNALREEIKALEVEVDKWRRDYYDLRDKNAEINSLYQIALEKIRTQSGEPVKPIDSPPAV
jgi:archaellum component FlaC